MKTNTWRWVNDWRGLHLKRVWVDEASKKTDFELPEDIVPDEFSKIESLGPGILSWFYIQFLKLKYNG